MSNSIEIKKVNIVDLDTDCIVNAANTGLWKGGGVCGAIFAAAGAEELEAACDEIGHCDEGSAVITPGFKLKARYVIHAVGPHWHGGTKGEPERLYSAYRAALKLVQENDCHSVGFPLISAGIFSYPIMEAWGTATKAIADYFDTHPDADIRVVFAVLDTGIEFAGKSAMSANGTNRYAVKAPAPAFDSMMLYMEEDDEPEAFEMPEPEVRVKVPEGKTEIAGGAFTVEGITYSSKEQYIMAKKALVFEDIKRYFEIMAEGSPERCIELGSHIRGFDEVVWNSCKDEIVRNAEHRS